MKRHYLPTYRTNREYESPLHEYRVAMGLTIRELSTYSGVTQTAISSLANGSTSPLCEKKKGTLKQSARILCDFFKVSPGELFPRYICELDRKKSMLLAKYEDNIISNISEGSDPYMYCEKLEKRKTLLRSLKSLAPMEREFLSKYFFYGYTYMEIAAHYNVCPERVRQRIAKSLKKLRHPNHCQLRYFFEN